MGCFDEHSCSTNNGGAGGCADDLAAVADELRQLKVDCGLRPYKVFSVVVEWSSGELYRGCETVICEQEFTPTPYIDLRPMYTVMSPVGQLEHGDVVMREISPTLSEDQVRNLCFDGFELKNGQQKYIEVRYDERNGTPERRRRFVIRGVPWHDAERFEWVVTLSDQNIERDRAGLPEEIHEINPPKVYRPS